MSVKLACGSHKIPDGNNFPKKGSFQFTKGTVHHGREVTWQEREAGTQSESRQLVLGSLFPFYSIRDPSP